MIGHPRMLFLLATALAISFLGDWANQCQADDDPSNVEVEEAGSHGSESENTVVVTGASQQQFPRIAVQFEVRRPDQSFLLDAVRDDFRVAEDGKEVKVLEFLAPRTIEAIPTTIVLVVDRSGSMKEEHRIDSLKDAVASFLERLPQGSRIAVVAFDSKVRLA